jgi:hypothetical protein
MGLNLVGRRIHSPGEAFRLYAISHAISTTGRQAICIILKMPSINRPELVPI